MDNKEKNKNRPFFLYAALGLLIFFGVQQYNENTNAPESVSFSEFKLLITENKVTSKNDCTQNIYFTGTTFR